MTCTTLPQVYHKCRPDGVINPKSCVYLDAWLNLF